MTAPRLDDRTYDRLVGDAVAFVRSRGGDWDDLEAGDPGLVLLEVFAFLTETLLYRLNRVPELARREFLGLLGTIAQPPAAAAVTLTFDRTTADDADPDVIVVPAGTRVATGASRAGPTVTFTVARAVELTAVGRPVSVEAHQCEQVEAEPLGVSDGTAGQSFHLGRAPVVLPTGHELDLVIGVEADPSAARADSRMHDGRAYEVWPVVESFASSRPDQRAVRVDRTTGLVSFAPAVRRPDPTGGLTPQAAPMAAVPAAGRRILAWYRVGGGRGGNVAAGTITTLAVAFTGSGSVTVTNPDRASGGRDGETVDEALRRVPQQFHEPRRAVTADDFEALATRLPGISRARATTSAEHWRHAVPGTVELRVLPEDPLGGPADDHLLVRTTAAIALAQPLGIHTDVGWVRLKEVGVQLRVVIAPSEDPDAVRTRVAERLRVALSPDPVAGNATGWAFGQPLRASNVYDIALREPGVRYADRIAMALTEAPDGTVRSLEADHFQPDTWYAAQGSVLFRSENGGVGWEAVHDFGDGPIARIVAAPSRPGRVACVVGRSDESSSRLFVSTDCGTTWPAEPAVGFTWTGDDQAQTIRDLAWLPAGHPDDLLAATDRGLYRVRVGDDAPRAWLVDPATPTLGCWAVAVSATGTDAIEVAVATQSKRGVWLSSSDANGVFQLAGLDGSDIRRLIVEERGQRRFLWAPAFAVGDDPGTGCHRRELRGRRDLSGEWTHLGTGWNGGICHDIALLGDRVLAASEFNGVLVLDRIDAATPWRPPSVIDSGLPLLENRRFQPVVALRAAGEVALAGTARGVHRTVDGTSFADTAQRVLSDVVTLPPSWLFRSGAHVVDVEVEGR